MLSTILKIGVFSRRNRWPIPHGPSPGPGGPSPGSAKKTWSTCKNCLVVWNIWIFSIFVPFSWECHDPNWLIFFRKGSWLKVAQPPTSSPCVSWAYSRVYQVVAKGCCVPIQCFYGSRTPIYPCYINGYTRGTRGLVRFITISEKSTRWCPILS